MIDWSANDISLAVCQVRHSRACDVGPGYRVCVVIDGTCVISGLVVAGLLSDSLPRATPVRRSCPGVW